MNRLFSSGGQNIGALASASVLPMNIQGCFPLELTGLISLLCKGLSHITVFSSATVQKDLFFYHQFSSVHFSCSVMSSSLHSSEPQHARPPCPSPTPGVHPNPCPLSWRCHPTISSSVVPFSSLLQSFPASRKLTLF